MIKVDDLKNSNHAVIIDIRTSYEYLQGHIKGSISIPYYNLLNNYSHYLNKYQLYYLYCDYGVQSREISNRLNQFGYHTDSISGGYIEYKKYYNYG